MVLRVLIFLLIIPSAGALAADSAEICSLRNDPRRSLSVYQKIFAKLAFDEKEKKAFSVSETKFIADNPLVAVKMSEVAEDAAMYANIFCRPKVYIDNLRGGNKYADTEDNEVDAIRHFVGATLLAYKMPKQATQALMAHELRDKKPLDSANLMDIKNNRIGVDFGTELLKKSPSLSDEDISKAALKQAVQLLKVKELTVLKTAKSGACAKLSEKRESEIEKSFQAFESRLQTTIKTCDEQGMPRNRCGIQNKYRSQN